MKGGDMSTAMNIGEASKQAAVSAKMIRHYESLGLLPKVARSDAGYRQYDDAAVHTLRFIRRARDLGFGMREIENLLALWRNRKRASGQVKRIALEHAADLQRRIAEMQAMQRTLEHLAHCCSGDDRPDCPILDDLAGEQAHS
jgi:Cu(I)-responsive transcriptional regulator